jgi:hypothetical protein
MNNQEIETTVKTESQIRDFLKKNKQQDLHFTAEDKLENGNFVFSHWYFRSERFDLSPKGLRTTWSNQVVDGLFLAEMKKFMKLQEFMGYK